LDNRKSDIGTDAGISGVYIGIIEE
jgi:hypothetical protein